MPSPKIYHLKPLMSSDEIEKKEGTYFDEKYAKIIIDHDADVYGEDPTDSTKEILLAKFRKNVIPENLTKIGWESFHRTAKESRNRGAAAGPIDLKSPYWKKRKPVKTSKWMTRYIHNGKVSKANVNNNVYSSVLGYFEKTPFMKVPCRMTSYTQKYFEEYQMGLPFIEAISEQFRKLVPDKYKLQYEAVHKSPYYQIRDTAFSSVTVNRNFRTALHKDAGDFEKGFGNLSVVERGKYHGGYTLFPRYGVGFNVRTGDFIAMNVHEWHCNTEMYETKEDKEFNKKLKNIYQNHDVNTGTMGVDKKFTRISFVCYFREKLQDCNVKESREYHKKVGIDPDKGFIHKLNKTRKNTHKGAHKDT